MLIFCCCLVIKSCPTLHDPMDQSTPGPPVFHCLPELCQIHVGCFADTVQPSHPRSSPSPPAFTLPNIRVFSRESSLLQSIGASASGSVLPVSTQAWFPLEWIGLFSLQCRGLSRVSSSTTIQKHQFFGSQLSLWSSSHFHTAHKNGI